MFIPLSALFTTLLTVSSSFSPVNARTSRGLAWATDNRYAPRIANLPLIEWYHHWQDGAVSTMPSDVEFVPMFWGPKYWDKWNQRKAGLNQHPPRHLMAFNEPDISGQANMNPFYAAELFMQEIFPFSRRGTKVGSPAIVWKIQWMRDFLGEVRKRGGHVDFMCIHWYGSWNALGDFKRFVTEVHNTFNINLWITEIGITSGSRPSDGQVKNFVMNAFSWMDTQPYIERASWFGCFENTRPPDAYATGKNAFFRGGGALDDLGYWYAYSSRPDKRSIYSRHHMLTRADVEADDAGDDGPVHCDEWCLLRKGQYKDIESREPDVLELDAREAELDAREPETDAQPLE